MVLVRGGDQRSGGQPHNRRRRGMKGAIVSPSRDGRDYFVPGSQQWKVAGDVDEADSENRLVRQPELRCSSGDEVPTAEANGVSDEDRGSRERRLVVGAELRPASNRKSPGFYRHHRNVERSGRQSASFGRWRYRENRRFFADSGSRESRAREPSKPSRHRTRHGRSYPSSATAGGRAVHPTAPAQTSCWGIPIVRWTTPARTPP